MKETYLIKYTEYPIITIDGFLEVDMKYKLDGSIIIHEYPQNLTDEYLINNYCSKCGIKIRHIYDIIKLS